MFENSSPRPQDRWVAGQRSCGQAGHPAQADGQPGPAAQPRSAGQPHPAGRAPRRRSRRPGHTGAGAAAAQARQAVQMSLDRRDNGGEPGQRAA
ncbi:MAG: hypothetical protein ACLQDY_19955 [Streptosporangiaceae bacterium]